jgi:hypothetical protein
MTHAMSSAVLRDPSLGCFSTLQLYRMLTVKAAILNWERFPMRGLALLGLRAI